MSLNSKIENISKSLNPNGTFKLSSYFKANVDSHDIESYNLPLIILDNEIIKDGQVMLNNSLQLNQRIVMRFLTQDDPLKTDIEREVIRQSMEDLALKVMVNIYQLDEVRILTGKQGFRLMPAFNVFSSDLTGVVLDINANENKIINWCES